VPIIRQKTDIIYFPLPPDLSGRQITGLCGKPRRVLREPSKKRGVFELTPLEVEELLLTGLTCLWLLVFPAPAAGAGFTGMENL
jgi:hypothetical protein